MTQDEIFAIIIENTREVLPELEAHDFKTDDRLRDLGANSIDRSEIVMMTLETLELEIPLVELGGVENIGELAATLASKF